jgi:hypothetical protein
VTGRARTDGARLPRRIGLLLLWIVAVAALGWWFFGQATTPGAVEPTVAAEPVENGESIAAAIEAAEAAGLRRSDAPAAADAPTADAAPAGVPAAAGLRFLGRCVAAEDSAPLAGVQVRMDGSVANDRLARERGQEHWEPPPPLQTGADGRFEFLLPPLQAHQLYFAAQHPDRVTRTDRWRPGFEAGAVVDLGDVAMSRGQRLRGRVQDADGRAVGAIVSLRGMPLPLRADSAAGDTLSARTLADGSFEFASAVPPGTWRLTAEGEGWMLEHPEAVEIHEREAPPPLLITMRALAAIEGRVVDESGVPVARAYVSVREPRGDYGEADWTDAEGRFVIHQRNRDGSPVSLRVEAKGFLPREFPAPLDWGAREVVLQVSRGRAVTLQVVEKDGGAPVLAYGVRSAAGPAGTRLGGLRLEGEHPDGIVEVGALPEGVNQLRVVPSDPALLPSAILEVDASAPAAGAIRVELDRLQSFEVLVRYRDGNPAADSQLRLFDSALAHEHAWEDPRNSSREIYTKEPLAVMLAQATAGQDGRAQLFAPSSAAEVFLDARGPHLPTAQALVRPLAQAQPIEVIVSRGATLQGSLRLPPDLLGSYALMLRGVPPGGGELGVPGWTNAVAPGADGRFAFTALAPGDYRLYLAFNQRVRLPGGGSHSGWRTLDDPLVELALATDEVRDLDFAPELAECSVSAQFFLDGAPLVQRPVALARVTRDFGRAGWIAYGSFLTDTQGRIQATGLLPGEYLATALLEISDGERIELAAEPRAILRSGIVNECRFDLRRRPLRIQVLAAEDGRPLAGWTCSFAFLQQTPAVLTDWSWTPEAALETGADGSLLYEATAAGEVVLHLRLGKESRVTESFLILDVAPSATMVLRARLVDQGSR